MKRVLIVMPTLRMGGAEKSLVSLLSELDGTKYSVDLLLFSKEGPLLGEAPAWVNIIDGGPLTKGMLLEFRYYFKGLIKAGHIDAAAARLVMLLRNRLSRGRTFNWGVASRRLPKLPGHYDVAVSYLEGASAFYVADKVDADRKIAWIHTDMSKRSVETISKESALYSRFDRVVTISDVCNLAFAKRYPAIEGRIHTIPNIVSEDYVKRLALTAISDDWAKGPCHIVTVGRLSAEKGIDLAIEACGILVRRGLDVCWHVYGEGVLRPSLQKQADALGLTERFRLEGIRQNPYPYMKRATLIVQPSRYEGKSIALDEAKILGKAIVVTDYPSVRDQVTDGMTGLITGLEPASIAEGIERLIRDEALRRRLEENCMNEENTSAAAIADIERLLDGKDAE